MDDVEINRLADEFAEYRVNTARDFEFNGIDLEVGRQIWKTQALEVLRVLNPSITKALI